MTPFGKIVVREATTDIEGTITIPTNVFAPGSFNEYSGAYTLTLLTTDRDPLKLMFNGKDYDVVTMSFCKVDSTDPLYKNIIE